MTSNSQTRRFGTFHYGPNLRSTSRFALIALGVGLMAASARTQDVPSHTQGVSGTIKVFVDGDRVHFEDVGPQEINGRILVPIRGVLEKVGANVDWTPETQRVNCSNGDIDIVLHIGDRNARVNGHDVQLDVAAQTVGGHTMVPLRFLSESLGAKVRWDWQESTVFIMTPDAGKHLNDRTRQPDGNLPRDPNRPRRREGDRPSVNP